MLFKNLLIYRFTKPFTYSPEELDEKLAEKTFKPCGSQEMFSFGWAEPLGQESAPLVHTANGCMMLCLQRQDRILPAAVIKEALEAKVAEIQERDDRKPGRKERMDLKDEITFELMPRAFTRSGRLFAYIDPREGLLYVNSGSHKRAEELLTYLRETLGSLPVLPLQARNQVESSMTHWLKSDAPAGFELGGECELRDAANESAVIRCKHQDLGSKEISNHLDAGMFVTKLELSWTGGIDFMLDDQLAIKRVSFSDLIKEKIGETDAETAAEQFDIDFAIMSGEFQRFVPALLEALGGENVEEGGEPLQEAS